MSNDSSDDTDLFRRAMRDVRPLRKAPGAEARAPRPAPVPTQRHADDRAVMAELLAPAPDDTGLGPERGEALTYLRDGFPPRLLRRLRRGHFSIAAEVDLHGMTVAQAHGALTGFLSEARGRAWRCVRVVHGKGRRSSNRGPVIKGKVDRWLRRRDDVIAFCSARPVDGGTGAVYVLLRH